MAVLPASRVFPGWGWEDVQGEADYLASLSSPLGLHLTLKGQDATSLTTPTPDPTLGSMPGPCGPQLGAARLSG